MSHAKKIDKLKLRARIKLGTQANTVYFSRELSHKWYCSGNDENEDIHSLESCVMLTTRV